MPIVEQEFMRPDVYGTDRGDVSFSADDLGRLAENTNRMLENGLQVPIFPFHPPPGSLEGGPVLPGEQRDARDVVGWVKGFKKKNDGSISQKLEILDEDAFTKIKDGRIKFTSPEIHPSYRDGLKRYYGPAIRHVALTPKPRNPNQGDFKIVAFSEDTMSEPYQVTTEQFAEDRKKPDGSEGDPALQKESDYSEESPPTGLKEPLETEPQEEPAMSLTVTPKAVMLCKQIASALEGAGISAPTADLAQDSEGWLGQLLAALSQKTRTEADELSKKLDEQSGMGLGVTEESSYMNQFGEDTLTELTKHEDAAVREMAVQFSELKEKERAEASKRRFDEAVSFVKESKLLPAVKEKLLEGTQVEQFSEEGSELTFTLKQVVELLEANTPPGMQFAEGDAAEEGHQEGEEFFDDKQPGSEEAPLTREQARSIVDDLAAQTYSGAPQPVASN